MKPYTFQKAPLALALGSAMAAMAFSPSALACTPDGTADTFTVTNTNAFGNGSLLQQVSIASESGGCDIVDFDLPAGSTITVADSDVPEAYGDVSIQGPGSGDLTITNNGSYGQVLNASGADLSVSGLTLDGGPGSGLWASDSDVALDDVVIQNMADSGVYANYYSNSSSEENFTFSVKNSLISDNGVDSPFQGGGVYLSSTDYSYPAGYGGTVDVDIENSTIADNQANGYGGGVYLYTTGYGGSVDVTLLQSTISGNEAMIGGAVHVSQSMSPTYERPVNVSLLHSTITNNTADYTGGITSYSSGDIVLNHTIVAGNTSESDTDNPDLDGDFEAIYSFIGVDGPNATVNDDGNSVISGGDPQLLDLAALAELEGIELPREAMVHVPDENSPVIDAGDMALQAGEGGIPETDQAGLPRVSLDYIDIGAVERPPEAVVEEAVEEARKRGSSAMGPGILALLISALGFRRRR